MLPDTSDQKENHVRITNFVDAYHAHDIETLRYVTVVLMFLKNPVIHPEA